MDVPQAMLDAKDTLAAALQVVLPFFPGLQAVDVGVRNDGPELTDELVIRVMVADIDQIPVGLSDQIGDVGFPVAIVERELTPLIDNVAHDPMPGGITICAAHGGALVQSGAGRLFRWQADTDIAVFAVDDGFAIDALFGGVVGVSCAHVIAESDQEVHQGDPIFQPGANRQVGRLFRWQADTDIAVFAVDDGFAIDASIADIGVVSGMARAEVDNLVRKRGRTTELTLGKVSGIGLAPLGRTTPANSLEIWARNLNAPIFCKPGDSGSLIINENDQAVGILTQKGIEFSRLVTIGSPPAGAISGFATQMVTKDALIGAADSVGIAF